MPRATKSKRHMELVGGMGHWMFSLSDSRNGNSFRADFDLFIASIIFFPACGKNKKKTFSLIPVMYLQSTHCSSGWPVSPLRVCKKTGDINRTLSESLKRRSQLKSQWDASMCRSLGSFTDDSSIFFFLTTDAGSFLCWRSHSGRCMRKPNDSERNVTQNDGVIFCVFCRSVVSQLWQKPVNIWATLLSLFGFILWQSNFHQNVSAGRPWQRRELGQINRRSKFSLRLVLYIEVISASDVTLEDFMRVGSCANVVSSLEALQTRCWVHTGSSAPTPLTPLQRRQVCLLHFEMHMLFVSCEKIQELMQKLWDGNTLAAD